MRRSFVRACNVLQGTVTSWHPFDRKGTIVVNAAVGPDGLPESKPAEYTISGGNAFESIMPTNHRVLNGAKVTFKVDPKVPSRAVGIIVDVNTIPKPSEDRLKEDAERDYLDEGIRPIAKVRDLRPKAIFSREFLDEVKAKKTGTSGQSDEESAAKKAEQAVQSTRLVDKRVVKADSLLDDLLRARHKKDITAGGKSGGDSASKKKNIDVRRTLNNGNRLQGVVLAWSTMRRTGVVIVVDPAKEDVDATVEHWRNKGIQNVPTKDVFFINGSDSFDTVMPTSQSLAGRLVSFMGIEFLVGEQAALAAEGKAVKGKQLAENITVTGDLTFDAVEDRVKLREKKSAAKLLEELDKEEAAKGKRTIHSGQLRKGQSAENDRQLAMEDNTPTFLGDDEAAPEGTNYGVVVRWSGGQGVVESSKGRLFYIESAADFEQLVDSQSQHLRGSVVEFVVEPSQVRYAKKISLLSGLLGERPVLSKAEAAQVAEGEENLKASATEKAGTSSADADLPAEDAAQWVNGTLVLWSAAEKEGIIRADEEFGAARYVVHGANAIHQYDKVIKGFKIEKGCRVRFIPFGSTGKLASSIVFTNEVVDLGGEIVEREVPAGGVSGESQLSTSRGSLKEMQQQMEQQQTDEERHQNPVGPSTEALGVSSGYWIQRLERSGFDVGDYKKMKESTVPLKPEDAPDDLMEKDPWFNDPTKNTKIPGTNVRRGDLAKIGPASMVDLSMRMRDPELLQKQKRKMEDKLTPEQHEYAMRKAKEHAPKYLEYIKKMQYQGGMGETQHNMM